MNVQNRFCEFFMYTQNFMVLRQEVGQSPRPIVQRVSHAVRMLGRDDARWLINERVSSLDGPGRHRIANEPIRKNPVLLTKRRRILQPTAHSSYVQRVEQKAPEEIFPENIWAIILGFVADPRKLRGVSQAFDKRFVPHALCDRIEELRQFPGAVPALARFHIQLPEKSASSDEQLEFVHTVLGTIANITKKMRPLDKERLDKLLPFSSEHVAFCPFEITKFFQTTFKILATWELSRISLKPGQDPASYFAEQNQLMAEQSTDKFEQIWGDFLEKYSFILFYVEQEIKALTEGEPPRKRPRIS